MSHKKIDSGELIRYFVNQPATILSAALYFGVNPKTIREHVLKLRQNGKLVAANINNYNPRYITYAELDKLVKVAKANHSPLVQKRIFDHPIVNEAYKLMTHNVIIKNPVDDLDLMQLSFKFITDVLTKYVNLKWNEFVEIALQLLTKMLKR